VVAIGRPHIDCRPVVFVTDKRPSSGTAYGHAQRLRRRGTNMVSSFRGRIGGCGHPVCEGS